MCLTVPYRLVRIDGFSALGEFGGQTRELSLLLMSEPVAVGDYVLAQVGDFAVEKVDAATADEIVALLKEIPAVAAGGRS